MSNYPDGMRWDVYADRFEWDNPDPCDECDVVDFDAPFRGGPDNPICDQCEEKHLWYFREEGGE